MGKGNKANDCNQLGFLNCKESLDGTLDISRKREVGIGSRFIAIGLIVSENVSGLNVEDVGSGEVVVGIKIADLEVSSFFVLKELDEHDLGDIVFSFGVVLDPFNEW